MGKEKLNLALNWDFSKLPKLDTPLLLWESMITLTPLLKDELENIFLTPELLLNNLVEEKYNEEYPVHEFRVLNTVDTGNGLAEYRTDNSPFLVDFSETAYPYGPKPYRTYFSRDLFGKNPKYGFLGWYSKGGIDMNGDTYYDPDIKYDRVLLGDSQYPSIYRKMFYKISDLNNKEIEKRDKGNYIMEYGENPEMMTLHTKGKQVNLASFPVLLADSIAFNAGRANIPIWTGFGIIGQEGTFIGDLNALRSGINKKGFNLHDYTNNHAFFVSPYYDISSHVLKENPKTDKDIVALERRILYALEHPEKQLVERTKLYSPHIMTDAFMRYAANPNGYNSGSKKAYGITYSEAINRLVEELKTSPELQEYIKTRGLELYNKGKEQYGK